MRLSWAEIHQVRSIQFRESEERGFRAVFFDQVGNQASAELTLALHCEGEGACDGVCTLLDQDDHCGECYHTCQPGSLCDSTSRTCACEVGYHACADTCLLDTSSASCGLRCQPCPGDANGITTCEADQCGVECHAGFRYCQDLCRPCPTTGVAVARCRGDAMDCIEGYLACEGACARCPDDPQAVSFQCNADVCEAQACGDGYHLCDGQCVSDEHANHCGDRCTPCPDSPDEGFGPVCRDGQCLLGCADGYTLCRGQCRRVEDCQWRRSVIDEGRAAVRFTNTAVKIDPQGHPHVVRVHETYFRHQVHMPGEPAPVESLFTESPDADHIDGREHVAVWFDEGVQIPSVARALTA